MEFTAGSDLTIDEWTLPKDVAVESFFGNVYLFNGRIEETVFTNASDNTSEAAIVENVSPKSDGSIRIEAGAGSNNNNGNKFFYINALRISPNRIETGIASDMFPNVNEIQKVDVYNTQGVWVYSGKNLQGFFDSCNPSNGFPEMYVVKAIAKNGVQTFKIMK
ncbi:MAG: hypothetical protein LBP83_08435 [Dysgonamonadaceae bacterium]|jgi:hypothetical protein|nr:hypothetical protein [Dysgonamonadaceae bacterium]